MQLALGGMQAAVSEDRDQAILSGGTARLRYGTPRAWDAQGRDLQAWVEAAPDGLQVVVEDEGAAWPVVVDPLLENVGWQQFGGQANTGFGYSPASAGDVNGDGFGDVIVGALFYDLSTTNSNEGRALLFLGSSTGLATTASWTAEGAPGAKLGNANAGVGDVNGDGYDDVAVGAYQYSGGESQEGIAYLYLGSASGLASSPAWQYESDQAGAQLGSSVAGAGDVDGDGYADVLVAAPYYDTPAVGGGRVFLFSGGPSPSGLSAAPTWQTPTDQAGALLRACDGAGDVDGDGYSDVIVGTEYYDTPASNAGAVWLYRGSATGLELTAPIVAEGPSSGDGMGTDVAGAGDVDGDGYADVIVGARGANCAYIYLGEPSGLAASAAWTVCEGAGGTGSKVRSAGDVNGDGYADVIGAAEEWTESFSNEGKVWLYLGSESGPSTTAAWEETGGQTGALYYQTDAAGDVNGDGFADLIVGAHLFDDAFTDEGAAFLYYGSGSMLGDAAGWTAEPDQAEAHLGHSVSAAGDVNGDGYDDAIVGAPDFDGGEQNEGAAFVYLGSAAGLQGTEAWTAESDQADAAFGTSVASAGDVNGDGYGDVVVGAPDYNGGEAGEGGAFLYLGSPSGLEGAEAWTAESDQANASFGTSVASAGDVNADGFGDVIVGAPHYSNNESSEGGAFLYLGSATGLLDTAVWAAESDQADSYFGTSVASAGDLNGDGYGDVVVGTPYFDGGHTNEGKVDVFFGGPSGLGVAADWTRDSDLAASTFGSSVASAGDVNGDGYGDLVVGAPNDVNTSGDGGAFFYLGSASGPGSIADWSVTSGQAGAFMGSSVASAGDVNGDGFGDVVVGAEEFGAAAGRAYLYLGSVAGPSLSEDWTAEPGQDGALFGYSVAAAGDVDGDGYSDLIVGAAEFTSGESDEGAAFLYYGNGADGTSAASPLRPIARQPATTTPIAPGGASSADDGFDVAVLARTAFGRADVKLQVEAKPRGAPFDGQDLQESAGWTDPGLLGVEIQETVIGLDPDTAYHWRARLRYDRAASLPQGWSQWLWGGLGGEPEGVHVWTGPCADADGDGTCADADCDDTDATSYPGAPELCDGRDNDCNGAPDADADGEIDSDGDGTLSCADCDDDDPSSTVIADDPDCDGLAEDMTVQDMLLLALPGGTFEMGCTASQSSCEPDESPAHEVTLTNDFWLGETEVTQAQWQALMATNPSYFGPNGGGSDCGPDCPVELVNWYEAAAFANALSTSEGLAPCYTLDGCTGTLGGGLWLVHQLHLRRVPLRHRHSEQPHGHRVRGLPAPNRGRVGVRGPGGRG